MATLCLLHVCVRMAAHAHCSIPQSVSRPGWLYIDCFYWQEQLQLYNHAQRVTAETFNEPLRQIPRWVTYLTPIIRNFFWDA